jgi:hypothetical protein
MISRAVLVAVNAAVILLFAALVSWHYQDCEQESRSI